jgi:hypothetical protein
MALNITLPDTPEVRSLLLQLGGHLADDVMGHYEDIAEECQATGCEPEDITIPKGSTPQGMVAAAAAINDGFLNALGWLRV